MGKTKSDEEKEFYLRIAIKERWSKRELERQIDLALFERSVVSPPKLSPVVRKIHPEAENIFKDEKVVEYALSRTLSPALVSEYQIHLPDKNMLRQKLHEFYELTYRSLADQEK